jgi:hypothetical protein
MRTLLCLALLLVAARAHFEVMLERRAYVREIDTTDEQGRGGPTKCPHKLTSLKDYGATNAPQICVDNDLFFTTKVMVGTLEYNHQILDLAVDINLPWTWVKQTSCKACDENTDIPEDLAEGQKLKCTGTCRIEEVAEH